MKTIFKISKYLCLILGGIILICSEIAFANNEVFQNNLLKIELNKNDTNGIKVVLYTSKPYKDAIVTNPKNEFEYVILMPETSNSLTGKPSFKNVPDLIKSIDVKTVQYDLNQNQKGYTKIVFATLKPVEIAAQAKTVEAETAKISEKEMQELLAQTSQKPKAIPVIPQKSSLNSTLKASTEKKETISPQKTIKRQTVKDKTKNIVKPLSEKKSDKITSALSKNNLKSVSKTSTKKIKEENKKEISLTPSQPVKKAAEIVQPKPAVQKTAESPIASTPVLSPQTLEVEPQAPMIEPQVPAAELQTSKLQRYKQFASKHLYELAAIILIPVIFLAILFKLARKTSKQLKSNKEIFTSNLNEKPSEVKDYSKNISEEMNWKEKYQAFKETEKQTLQEPEINTAAEQHDFQTFVNPSEGGKTLDNLFTENVFSTEEELEKALTEDDFEQESLEDFDNLDFSKMPLQAEEIEIAIDELFQEEDEEIKDEDIKVEPIQNQYRQPYIELPLEQKQKNEEKNEDEFIQSEFILDNNKGFYLVKFEGKTALVGKIGEEIFALKTFDSIITGKIQARLNENKGWACDYIVKIDRYKAMVEVSENSMNLLIEL